MSEPCLVLPEWAALLGTMIEERTHQGNVYRSAFHSYGLGNIQRWIRYHPLEHNMLIMSVPSNKPRYEGQTGATYTVDPSPADGWEGVWAAQNATVRVKEGEVITDLYTTPWDVYFENALFPCPFAPGAGFVFLGHTFWRREQPDGSYAYPSTEEICATVGIPTDKVADDYMGFQISPLLFAKEYLYMGAGRTFTAAEMMIPVLSGFGLLSLISGVNPLMMGAAPSPTRKKRL